MQQGQFTPLALPPEHLVYAVGDVHGRIDLMDLLLARIAADAAGRSYGLVFLGDYIDRGPASAKVIQRLLDLQGGGPASLVTLTGNHERMLLAFLDDEMQGGLWMDYGARPTLASYGIQPPRARTDAAGWTRAAAELRESMPPQHLQFLRTLPLGVEWGDYLFVHAGVRPGVPLEAQTPHDLTTIRCAFLKADYPGGERIVVFGHTPTRRVELARGKIGVDTGAYATGVLSALRIEAGSTAVLDSTGAIQELGA